jgi:hypothetical protein
MQTVNTNLPLITSEEAVFECNNLNEKILQAITVHLKTLGIPNDTNEICIDIPRNACIVSHPYLGDTVQVAKVTFDNFGEFLTVYYYDWPEESDLDEKNFSSLDLAIILREIEASIGIVVNRAATPC